MEPDVAVHEESHSDSYYPERDRQRERERERAKGFPPRQRDSNHATPTHDHRRANARRTTSSYDEAVHQSYVQPNIRSHNLHNTSSSTDARAPATHSPTTAQHTVAVDESDAVSLNQQFQQFSGLGGERRHGNRSTTTTTQAHRSSKRTTDQMHGADSISQTDSRKKRFSPSATRSPVSMHPSSPGLSHTQPKRFVAHDPSESILSTHNVQAHYHHVDSDNTHKHSIHPPSASGATSENAIVKQPATRPITEQQLINEVKGIYAGLVMVERKCVDIIDQQTKSNKRLTDQQWKALVALHRTLLQEHHDFFSASQHPTASENLKKLATKYAMPARMWRHGIHAFLELLRHRLPDSMEHMLSFIYLAYSMMALLKESVPSFVETWIECLGDLARYRMAIEDSDPRDREIWSNVAKMWYNEAADKSPNVGRIQHHLAVLARPNIVEQLFYYDKALVSIIPFINARESIMLLFDMFLKNHEAVQSRYPLAEYAFVYYNALLFTRQSPAECRKLLELFRSSFGSHIDRTGARFKIQGPEMASALFAGHLDFGKEFSHLWGLYEQDLKDSEAHQKVPDEQDTQATPSEIHAQLKHKQYWETLTPTSDVERLSYTKQIFAEQEHVNSSSDVVTLAALLTMDTISLVSCRIGDKNIVPFMHVVLANLWDMSFVVGALVYIEGCIPWENIAQFLNTLGRSGVSNANVESDQFPPSHGGHGKQLPEDFIMRGMMTTRHYYKRGFFAEPLVDEDERTIELPSHQAPRAERCLWLGVRLAKLGRYLTYNTETKQFDVTECAKSLAKLYV